MLDRVLRSIANKLPQDVLHVEERGWLPRAQEDHALLRAKRARVVATRVRLLAWLFLALTPAWVLVEYFALPVDLWLGLSAARLAVVVAFMGLLLALRTEGDRPWPSALALAGLFLVPTAFYLAAALLLGRQDWSGLAQAVVATHTFFPLLLVAGISLFPLTVKESLGLAIPILLARTVVMWRVENPGDLYALLGALWFLSLIAGVGILAAASQLSYFVVLLRKSIRDPLTGAFSRAAGEELLELEFGIAARGGRPISVAFIDLDHFKAVNDRFGHDAGDRILAQAARAITGVLRTTDVLVRWGGEEFLVILPGTACSQAMVGLDRLRLAGFGHRPDGQAQTASIGIAERAADSLGRALRLVELADRRMYQAKAAGRNRLVGCVPSQNCPEHPP